GDTYQLASTVREQNEPNLIQMAIEPSTHVTALPPNQIVPSASYSISTRPSRPMRPAMCPSNRIVLPNASTFSRKPRVPTVAIPDRRYAPIDGCNVLLGGPLSIGSPRRLYRRLKKPFEIMERCRIGQVDVL